MRKKRAENAISRKIRSLRKAMGYIQSDYAKLLGIGTRTLASWEVAEIEPSNSKLNSLIRICHKEAPKAVELHFNPAEWHYKGEEKTPLTHNEEDAMYRLKYEEKCEEVIKLQKIIIDAGLTQKKDRSLANKKSG